MLGKTGPPLATGVPKKGKDRSPIAEKKSEDEDDVGDEIHQSGSKPSNVPRLNLQKVTDMLTQERSHRPESNRQVIT